MSSEWFFSYPEEDGDIGTYLNAKISFFIKKNARFENSNSEKKKILAAEKI